MVAAAATVTTADGVGYGGAWPVRLVMANEMEIKAKDDKAIEIALYDTKSNSIVTEGSMSSTKIEICVLDGEFGSEDNWTADEFKAKTLHQRDDKAKLLRGDTVITLQNGVGYISNILFTDNSSWTRSRQFRLGAKVVQSTSNEANIKEGITKPFIVKHFRREAVMKNKRPSLNDEIIGNISRKSWDTIIEQAKTCSIDDDDIRYIYHSSASERSISLFFNCIYEVVEVSFNGQNPCSLESLNLDEKVGI
ncbi:hypothetical protein RIF29_24571 [Crotalaria pallida]|uniref:Uncharacterized protein n=1 Tax=Crotalaria pallida TaxID=3830 RepID=A0AAN9ES98_CROPI